jgi:hypothetical protein
MVISSNSSHKNPFGATGRSLPKRFELKQLDLSSQDDAGASADSLLTLSSAAANELLTVSRRALGSLLLNALLTK